MKQKLEKRKGIIFAADIIEKDKLLSVINQVAPFVECIKIGNLVLYKYGWDIIDTLKSTTSLPILADLKIMDIPEIAKRIAKTAFDAGADGITVCGTAGSETIYSCKEIMRNKLVFTITEFTHCDGLIDEDMANEYIELSILNKCDGIQVPGTKISRIEHVRRKVGEKLIIISCGVGTQKHCGNFQRTNFGSAITAGADFEIIGRAIYDSQNSNQSPRAAAQEAKKIIEEAISLQNNLSN